MSEGPRRVHPRVEGHIDELRKAGLNTQAFFDALVGIRDDQLLNDTQRDVLLKLIAHESFCWYLEALRGEPVDRFELLLEAQKIAEKNNAAIKKPAAPGESAAELLVNTMTKKPEGRQAPPDAPTKLDRPPPVKRPPRKTPPMGSDAPTRLDRPPPKKKD